VSLAYVVECGVGITEIHYRQFIWRKCYRF